MEEMKRLIAILNDAARAYYTENREIMSNLEYDKLYDKLESMEKEMGIILSDSPTQRVGYMILDNIQSEAHDSPMLSLDKTKDISALADFLGEQKAVLSWKLDGITISLTYKGGVLVKALTRGNGLVGEVVTSNARVFANIPLLIPYKGELNLRGEAIITYSQFEKINSEIPEADAKYKNPRNLCSGAVRQLNTEITASRKIRFIAFSLIRASDAELENSFNSQLEWLAGLGFEVVGHTVVSAADISDAVEGFRAKIKDNDFPSDGLVLSYDDIAYGNSLGSTAKFPRNAIAYKWQDEQALTHVVDVQWNASRTGLINPIAVFEPVELEGTTVSRASVHNVSILKELQLGTGDEIAVYKSNMIIPQIAKNLTRSGTLKIPDKCPSCGTATVIHSSGGVETLHCPNTDCPAKRIKSFALMVSRDALNVEGLSEATLERLLDCGYICNYADIFSLSRYRDKITEMEGIGEKTCENLLTSIEKARHTTASRLIYALGIPGVGVTNAKSICNHFKGDVCKVISASEKELAGVYGIGPIVARGIIDYFSAPKNLSEFHALMEKLDIEKNETLGETDLIFAGKQFVVTGSVYTFDNRKQLEHWIEERGGRVASSVSKKTDYLVNNDKESTSSKNKKAKELKINIISEEELRTLKP